MIKHTIHTILFLMILSESAIGGPSNIKLDQYLTDVSLKNIRAYKFFEERQRTGTPFNLNLKEVHENLDSLLAFISAQNILNAVLANDSLSNHFQDDERLFDDNDLKFQAEIVGRLLQEGAHVMNGKNLHVMAIHKIKDLMLEKEGASRFIEILMSSQKASQKKCRSFNETIYCDNEIDPEMNEAVRALIKDILGHFSNISSKIYINELYDHVKDTEFINLLKQHDMISCNRSYEKYATEIFENGLLEMFKNPQIILDQKYKNLSAKKSVVAKMPYIVHHIWLTHTSAPREIRPQDLAIVIANKRTFELSSVNWRHIVWTNDKSLIPESVKKLEAEGIEVCSICDYKNKLKLWEIIEDLIDKQLWGMASDALRYSIVHLFGGIYADLNFTFSRALTEEVHRYNFLGLSFEFYEIMPYMFLASQKHPVLDKALEIIDRNFKNPPEYIRTVDRYYEGQKLVILATFLKVTNAIDLAYYSCANMNKNIDVVYPHGKSAFFVDPLDLNDPVDLNDLNLGFKLLMKDQCNDLWSLSEAYEYISSNDICETEAMHPGDDSYDGNTWRNIWSF